MSKFKFLFILFPVLAAGLCLSRHAQGRTTSEERDIMKKVVALHNKSRTTAQFLESVRQWMRTDEYEFWKPKAAELGERRLPKLKVQGDDRILISDEKVQITFQVVAGAEGRFKFNNHEINFATAKSPQERFDLMLKAMPELGLKEKNALWNWLVPRAHAELSGLLFLAYFAGGSFIAAIMYNQTQCKELRETIDECVKQKSSILDYAVKASYKLAKFENKRNKMILTSAGGDEEVGGKDNDTKKKPKTNDDGDEMGEELRHFADLKQLRSENKCLPFAVNEELDNNVHAALSKIKQVSEQVTAEVAKCWSGDNYPSETAVIPKPALEKCNVGFWKLIRLVDYQDCRYAWMIPDNAAGGRNERLLSCGKSLYEMAKNMCLKRSTDLYEEHHHLTTEDARSVK